MLLGLVACAVAFAAGGLLSPLWLRSPQQLAADAEAPDLTTLTAPVERRVLRDVLLVRGVVSASQSFEVTPGTRASGQAIVTSVMVNRGDLMQAGSVVVEVSGRPLILLPGAAPAYRDIKPGASGKDVQQLQAALAGLGHEPWEHDGVFGSGTKRALASFYDALGYDPVPANDGDEERLAGLRRQVTASERAVADARAAVDALIADPEATAEQLAAAEKTLSRAEEDLALARNELAKAERVSGPMLPTSEYVFLPTFPARVDSLTAVLGREVTAPLITLSTGEPTVSATLTAAQRAVCRPGARVEITGDNGLSTAGTVTQVGDTSDGAGDAVGNPSANGYLAVVSPSPTLDPKTIGQNVLLKIEVAVSDGEQLVVPISALYAAGDGQVYVNKVLPSGRVERVEVEAGLSAEGYVEVTPKTGTLVEGDRVTIGEAAT